MTSIASRDNLRAALRAAGFAERKDIEIADGSGGTMLAHLLTKSGLRIFVYPEDGGRVDMHCFDGRGVLLYSARFDSATPGGIIQAAALAAAA